jgi:polyphenol oxidase
MGVQEWKQHGPSLFHGNAIMFNSRAPVGPARTPMDWRSIKTVIDQASSILDSRHFLPRWGLESQGVRTHLSTRCGGVSEGVYSGMNLGLHVGDDPQKVLQNRHLYAQQLGATPVFLNQVHGTRALELHPPWSNELHALKAAESADAAWTVDSGVACTMMVADCMPLLLADSLGRAVAAVHVGWRGLVGLAPSGTGPALMAQGGIIAQTLQTLRARLQSPLASANGHDHAPLFYAWLGPCIGPSAFEVGPEVRQRLRVHSKRSAPWQMDGPPALAGSTGVGAPRCRSLGGQPRSRGGSLGLPPGPLVHGEELG